ncbi:MAG: hypothetical protein U1F57_03155 [bacterium]
MYFNSMNSDLSSSVLHRFSNFELSQSEPLSAFQRQVDSAVSSFTEEAGNFRTLAAMATGSLFYRFGRLGVLALASRAQQAAPLLQVASYGIGLASEVTAFQGVNDLLSPEQSRAGRSYWERWRTSFVQFGLLKMGGAFAAGQNVLVRHAFQDAAMVAGHQATGQLGWTPAPEGSLAEQLLHAEVTNLQLAAGMGLVGTAAPTMELLERNLDLSLQTHGRQPFGVPPHSFALSEFTGPERAFAGASSRPDTEAIPFLPHDTLEPQKPFIVAMSSENPAGGGSRYYQDIFRNAEILTLEEDSQEAIQSLHARVEQGLKSRSQRPMLIHFKMENCNAAERQSLTDGIRRMLAEQQKSGRLPEGTVIGLAFRARKTAYALSPRRSEIGMTIIPFESTGLDADTSAAWLAKTRQSLSTIQGPSQPGTPVFSVELKDGTTAQIEGVPPHTQLKAVISTSSTATQVILRAFEEHLRENPGSPVVVAHASSGSNLENQQIVQIRIDVTRFLQNNSIPANVVLCVALIGPNTAFLFERTQADRSTIQVNRAKIEIRTPAPDAGPGARPPVPPPSPAQEEVAPASTVIQVFEHMQKRLENNQWNPVIYTGSHLHPENYAKWLQSSRHPLPQGKNIIIEMPNATDPQTRRRGQRLVFFWQGNKINWRTEAL